MSKRTDTDEMSNVEFIRHYMGLLKFTDKNSDGEEYFDWQRGAKFFGIRHELFSSMARGDAPILKRERAMMARKAELVLGIRVPTKRDARTVADLQNAKVGRYLRTLRERLFLVGLDGISKNQAQMAALMDVSIGAVQAWEYGRTRIPNARLDQYLTIVGADLKQCTKAWLMLGEMPVAVQQAIADEDKGAIELWDAFIEYCNELYIKGAAKEVTPEFVSHRQEQAYLKEKNATPEELKAAAAAPKPRKE